MKLKIGALIVSVTLLLSPVGVFADIDPVQISGNPADIPASGSLTLPSTFGAVMVNGSQLIFAGDSQHMLVKAPQLVRVNFNINVPLYQAVVVSTNNRENTTSAYRYNGEGTGAGLVNVDDRTVAAPLHWVVFDSQSQATNYTFTGNDAAEFYVVDRRQDEVGPGWNGDTPLAWEYYDTTLQTYPVIGYATVISGPSGLQASIANAPYDDGNGNQRTVTDGNVYMAFACDYAGQPAGQTYITQSLSLELITIS